MKKVIVFSAINITKGGPLTILHQFTQFANDVLIKNFEVYFLVKGKEILSPLPLSIKFLEFPNSQSTFFHKLFFEYFYFKKISKKLKPYIWFSLNDCTPSVSTILQCVYIHNATAFYQPSFIDFIFPSRVLLQRLYYQFFLRWNLNRNDFVVVQQSFMRDNIINLGFRKGKVLINRPNFEFGHIVRSNRSVHRGSPIIFIYPTKPEVYKNIHVLIKAFSIVSKTVNSSQFEVQLTICGNENLYSHYIKHLAKKNSQIKLLGSQTHVKLLEQLQQCDCLIFPSRLETWGLPLSEARYFDKFIIACDLPYARETLRGYDKCIYFNPKSPLDLANKIIDYVKDRQHRKIKKEEFLMPAKFAALEEIFSEILTLPHLSQ